MAIVWSKVVDGTHYQVRQAGSSTRLYTDGVFHSQYNENKKYSNGIWDLLVLPAFLQNAHSIKRVLVLGVGGGAAIRMLADYFKLECVVGVELNPIHLHIARRFFGLNTALIKLEHADAIDWVSSYRGPKFDLIIEDLFKEEGREPVRAVNFSTQWFNRLTRLLNPDGALVANFISRNEFRKSEVIKAKKRLKAHFSVSYFLDVRYDNVISFFRRRVDTDKPVAIPRTANLLVNYLPKSIANNLQHIRVGTVCR